jgi:glutathione S-transferase
MRLYDYAPSGNCYKARLAFSELGQQYERVPVDIFGGETLTEDFGVKNPARTTPVLEIGEGEYLAESNAILLYLTEGTDLLPEDKEDRAQVYRWLFFEQARIAYIIGGLRFRLLTGRASEDSESTRRERRMGEGLTAVVAAHLEWHHYLVADRYTVADLALYAYMHCAHEAGIHTEAYPQLESWFERVRERPGHVADLEPYPANAQRGQSQSIYDLVGL